MPGVEELLDVLPALLVARARDVGVRELVDERDLGRAGEDRVDVHLLEARVRGTRCVRRGTTSRSPICAAVFGAAVGLDEADHDVGAAAASAALPSLSIAKVLPTPGAAPR